ncbi:hypothetical protein GCM10027047_01680 [Rhodococcus aerolatus]
MAEKFKPRTLVSPKGVEYEPTSAHEENELLVGGGYRVKDQSKKSTGGSSASTGGTGAGA